MGLKGSRDQPADLESERNALHRQRAEAAHELAALKKTLSERVAEVQRRERELAAATARVEKREQKLAAGEARSSRLDSVRLRLAEAKEARAAGARVVSTQALPDPAASAELDAREAELAETARALAEREAELEQRATALTEREAELEQRATALTEREHAVEARERESIVSTPALEAAPPPDELERIEAKLTELREAEKAFLRTQQELAARSDALTEREAALAERERTLAAREAPPPSPDLELLEARIRRLEQGGQTRAAEAQTFSSGLRALQARGLRGNRDPDEPLH